MWNYLLAKINVSRVNPIYRGGTCVHSGIVDEYSDSLLNTFHKNCEKSSEGKLCFACDAFWTTSLFGYNISLIIYNEILSVGQFSKMN